MGRRPLHLSPERRMLSRVSRALRRTGRGDSGVLPLACTACLVMRRLRCPNLSSRPTWPAWNGASSRRMGLLLQPGVCAGHRERRCGPVAGRRPGERWRLVVSPGYRTAPHLRERHPLWLAARTRPARGLGSGAVCSIARRGEGDPRRGYLSPARSWCPPLTCTTESGRLGGTWRNARSARWSSSAAPVGLHPALSRGWRRVSVGADYYQNM
jgi:hypothetical protein